MTPRKLSVLACLAFFPACSDSQPASPGTGGAPSTGGAGAALGGGAGSPASAGSGGGATAAAGTGGGPSASGSGGTMASVGGVSGGGNGGGNGGAAGSAGSAGSGGVSGASGSGGASGAAGGAGLVGIASDFDKFRFECPCIDADHFGMSKTDNCDNAPEVDRQTHVKKLAGDSTVVYDVKLHVRGDTEPNTYVKGKLDPNMRFYVGGETSTPGYTAYMLTVADPQQVFFFNYNPSTSHIHFLLDYEVTIPMRGGTTLTFEVNGGKSMPDGHGVSNREQLVVPGIPPAPDPFNGQLVQFDVVSVTPRP